MPFTSASGRLWFCSGALSDLSFGGRASSVQHTARPWDLPLVAAGAVPWRDGSGAQWGCMWVRPPSTPARASGGGVQEWDHHADHSQALLWAHLSGKLTYSLQHSTNNHPQHLAPEVRIRNMVWCFEQSTHLSLSHTNTHFTYLQLCPENVPNVARKGSTALALYLPMTLKPRGRHTPLQFPMSVAETQKHQ